MITPELAAPETAVAGAKVPVVVHLQDGAPEGLRIRLWWAARGPDPDHDVVEIADEHEPAPAAQVDVELEVPARGPLSHEGELVRIEWWVTARARWPDGQETVAHHPIRVRAASAEGSGADVDAAVAERLQLRGAERTERRLGGLLAVAVAGLLAAIVSAMAATALAAAVLPWALAGLVTGLALASGIVWARPRPSAGPAERPPVLALGDTLRATVPCAPGSGLVWRVVWIEEAARTTTVRLRTHESQQRSIHTSEHVAVKGSGLPDAGGHVEVVARVPRDGPAQLIREDRRIVWALRWREADGERMADGELPLVVMPWLAGGKSTVSPKR